MVNSARGAGKFLADAITTDYDAPRRSTMAEAETESPGKPWSLVSVAYSGSRSARYPYVYRVIASLRHPGHRGCRGSV